MQRMPPDPTSAGYSVRVHDLSRREAKIVDARRHGRPSRPSATPAHVMDPGSRGRRRQRGHQCAGEPRKSPSCTLPPAGRPERQSTGPAVRNSARCEQGTGKRYRHRIPKRSYIPCAPPWRRCLPPRGSRIVNREA